MSHRLIHHRLQPLLQAGCFPTIIMKVLVFITLLPSTLALVAPLEHVTPKLRPRDTLWGTKSRFHSTRTRTVTITTTLTITVSAFPTANGTFPNITTPDAGVTATSSDDLSPITLITPLSETTTTTGSSDDLASITLIDVNTAFSTTTDSGNGDAAVPTPNDIEPITLIDITTVTPI
jgi:hypothetical protein